MWVMASRYENDPLETKIRPFIWEQSVHVVEISPLSHAESQALASQIQTGAAQAYAHAVEQAKGNPLFLTQLLFNADPSNLPVSLMEIVDYKLSLLDPTDVRAVQLMAALQLEVDLATLREMLADFHYSPEHPVKLRILRAVNEHSFAYSHDVIMRGVYDRMPHHELQQCHEKIAEYFEGKDDKLPTYIDAHNYAQHNPAIADGLDGLSKALAAMAQAGITMRYDRVHMVLGEGNFVLTVSEGEFAGKHSAFYDLFRVAGGKIVEHWDVIETIPPKSEWKNNNGKFGTCS
jgi:predicted SnoaL-like aldol condensation-catalyzing enzyme